MEYTLKLPHIFADDHIDRLGHELGLWEELKVSRNTVTVRMDQRTLDSLTADAAWYADTRNHDANWPALVRSAKRTLALCLAAT